MDVHVIDGTDELFLYFFVYSCRNAWVGFTRAARDAGM